MKIIKSLEESGLIIKGITETVKNEAKEEMEDIMKIIKSLEESGLIIKGITETVKNEAKEQKFGFLSMLLEKLAASIFGNTLPEQGVIRAGEQTVIAGQNF